MKKFIISSTRIYMSSFFIRTGGQQLKALWKRNMQQFLHFHNELPLIV